MPNFEIIGNKLHFNNETILLEEHLSSDIKKVESSNFPTLTGAWWEITYDTGGSVIIGVDAEGDNIICSPTYNHDLLLISFNQSECDFIHQHASEIKNFMKMLGYDGESR